MLNISSGGDYCLLAQMHHDIHKLNIRVTRTICRIMPQVMAVIVTFKPGK
jgi:hypothetical protein